MNITQVLHKLQILHEAKLLIAIFSSGEKTFQTGSLLFLHLRKSVRTNKLRTSSMVPVLVHGNFNLDRGINLNGGDALDDFHGTINHEFANKSYATRSITLLWILISR